MTANPVLMEHGNSDSLIRPRMAELDALVGGILRAIPEPALLVLATGWIVDVNLAAAVLFDLPTAALIGSPLANHAVGDLSVLDRFLKSCARTRSPLPGSLQRRLPSSDTTRQRLSGAVVRPAASGAPAVILLRFAVEENASNHFVFLNRQLAELTREVRARRTAEAALHDANERLREQALELELSNHQLQDQALELEHQIESAELLADQLVQANQELASAAAAAEEARAVADHANQAKSDFLAVMSHELRTPLNAIGGYAELLEMEIRGPVTPAQREDLERIQRAQRHLLVLISEVLSFARLEAGQVNYDLSAVPLHSLLCNLQSLVAPQLLARELHFIYESPNPAVSAWADREKLQQILLNLLSNAIKFTAPGGDVTVSCTSDHELVRIHVRDTGIGIAADKLERVFEPFVQLDQSLTRSRDGVGLGLAISHDLASGMHGNLTAASEEGVGTTFTLCLRASCEASGKPSE